MSLRLLRSNVQTPARDSRDSRDTDFADPGDHLGRGREAVESGRLEEALAIFQEGAELAAQRGDTVAEERMRCTRAGVSIFLDRDEDAAAPYLRRVLMASTSNANRFLAATNLSWHHDRAGVVERAKFYAKQALDHARLAGNREYLAQAHNRLGNLLVLESYFREAIETYGEALAHLPEERSVPRALLFANLGYCRVVTGELAEAFGLLFRGLRMMRHLGAPSWEVASRVRLSLCLAYLELGRLDRAHHHGEVALAAAEAHGDLQAVKHSLYLLGEVEKTDGSHLAAFSRFSRLQREFYPDSPAITDMLMVTATHKLINLMA